MDGLIIRRSAPGKGAEYNGSDKMAFGLSGLIDSGLQTFDFSNISGEQNEAVQNEIEFLGRGAQAESDFLNRDAQAEIDYLNRGAQAEMDYAAEINGTDWV